VGVDVAELVAVLAEGVEGDVVRGGDVAGLELGGGADVDEADVLAGGEPGVQFDGRDGGVHGWVILLVQAVSELVQVVSETRELAVM
jgi:hypothetical protein